MYDNSYFLKNIPGIEPDELTYLQAFTKNLSQEKMQMFISVYNGKRKKTDLILLTALLGLVGVAGVQRFLVDQIGMGILYFLTGGLCLIGTILDIINHKSLATEHNQKMAVEAMTLVGGV